jgi:hypothetical protein
VKGADDARSLWLVLKDRELPGLGFKRQKETKAAAEAADLSPISVTRMETIVWLLKERHAHVTGRPVDFLLERTLEEGLPCPEVIPVIMHTCMKVGKKVLKLLQKEGFGSGGELRNKDSNQEYVFWQIALIKTELLVKDEEKAGDSITLAMNGENVRLLFNRWREMWGDLLSPQWALIAELLSIAYAIIYSSLPPIEAIAVFLWLTTNLTWNLARILDQLASTKEKKVRKPVVQTNHFHCFVAEIPRVYEQLQPFLIAIEAAFHVVTEEALESYQKTAKTEGYNHSDRKANVIDTMIRGEQFRDWGITAYAMSRHDPSAPKRKNKRFGETVVPNLVISSCVYNLNAVFHRVGAHGFFGSQAVGC